VKLLVLGANSLLGRALVQLLQSRQVEFHAVDVQELDLLRKNDVIKAINSVRPDQVVNLATFSNLEKAEFDAAAARECDIVNSQGVSILAEVCRHLEVPLLHHSSSFVFDGQKVHPYGEDDLTNPVSRYGMSKWYGERAIRDMQPHHVILRTDWLFSREKPDFFLRHIDRCKQQSGRLEIVNHRFSPTPAADAARVLLAIARQVDCAAELWGTYHYCSLQPMSQDHFVEAFLQEAAKYDAELGALLGTLQITKLPVQLPYIPNTVLNSQRLFETFGIKQRSRSQEINALLKEIYRLHAMPVEPDPVTPDKGDIADRAEDVVDLPRVRKPKAAAKPAKKDAARKSSPKP
jgi:dTDP-4-dehydrorhamnose reductase